MKVVDRSHQAAEIQLSVDEASIITNSLHEVCRVLSKWDFRTRLGVFHEDATSFLQPIVQQKSTMIHRFSVDELVVIKNVLNEVCNGIRIPDFEEKIGTSRDEAKTLLHSVRDLVREID